tara:strand:- start:90 stop:689 length:600 start_codon:yes stop_codon:yes gene_type:complete
MKKINIFIIMIALFFNSCSVNHTILNPVSNSVDNKIKPLQLGLYGDNVFRDNLLSSVTAQTHYATLFRRTLYENVFENSEEGAWGYIDMRTTFNKKSYRGYMFVANFLLAPLNLFGIPFDINYEQQIEIGIYDSNKQLIKNYIFFDTTLEYINIFNFKSKRSIVPIKLLDSMLRDFESQVNDDADYINAQLEKSGKIKY